jgi:hypothetical protein
MGGGNGLQIVRHSYIGHRIGITDYEWGGGNGLQMEATDYARLPAWQGSFVIGTFVTFVIRRPRKIRINSFFILAFMIRMGDNGLQIHCRGVIGSGLLMEATDYGSCVMPGPDRDYRFAVEAKHWYIRYIRNSS